MGAFDCFEAWFSFSAQIIVLVFLIISQVPCKTSILYSHYFKLSVLKIPPDDSTSQSFGIWTSREHYIPSNMGDTDNYLNSFDHRIRAARGFMVTSLIVAIAILVFTSDRLFRRFAGPKSSREGNEEGDDWCKWTVIFLTGFQFYSVLCVAWLYSTLIDIDIIPWTLVIMCLNVGLTGLIGCIKVNAKINNPPHDPENGKIELKTRILFIIAIGLSGLSFFFLIGCLIPFDDPLVEGSEKKTSLMILTDSFKNHGFKTGVISFFLADAVANVAGISLLLALIYIKNPDTVYVILIITMEVIYIRYACSLVCTWIISRAPALLDYRVVSEGYSFRCLVMEIIKFCLVNAIVWLVIFGVVHPEKFFHDLRHPHYDSADPDSSSLTRLRSNSKKSNSSIWKEKSGGLAVPKKKKGKMLKSSKGSSQQDESGSDQSSDIGFPISEEDGVGKS